MVRAGLARISISATIVVMSGIVASNAAAADLDATAAPAGEPVSSVAGTGDQTASAAAAAPADPVLPAPPTPPAPIDAPPLEPAQVQSSLPQPPAEPASVPASGNAPAPAAPALDTAIAGSRSAAISATRLQSETRPPAVIQPLGGAGGSTPATSGAQDLSTGSPLELRNVDPMPQAADPPGDLHGGLAPRPGSVRSPGFGLEPGGPLPLRDLALPGGLAPLAAAGIAIATSFEASSFADSSPSPTGLNGALPPLPDPGSELPGSLGAAGSSGGSFFFTFAATLLGLLVLAGRAVSRPIRSAPVSWRPVPFVSLLERPG